LEIRIFFAPIIGGARPFMFQFSPQRFNSINEATNILTWTWYLLAKHPEIENKLRVEFSEILGERTPTFEDLSHLKYTLMVFQEAMRLYPPA
jgi:hypothetical protein